MFARPIRAVAVAVFAAVAFAALGPALATPAPAQTPTQAPPTQAPSPGQLSVEDLESLIKTLESEADRKAFVKTLKDLLAARKATAPKEPSGMEAVLGAVVQRARRAGAQLADLADFVADLPKIGTWLEQRFASGPARSRLIEGIWKALLVLVVGLAAGAIVSLLLRRPRRSVEDRQTESLLVRLGYLGIRTVIDLLPVVAFGIAAYATLPLTDPSPTASSIALAVIMAAIVSRAVSVLLGMLFAPRVGSLRILRLGDETAAYLFVWGRRIGNVIVIGFFGLVALNSFGLPVPVYDALLQLLGLIVTILLIILILQNRRAVAAWFAGAGKPRSRAVGTLGRRIGDVWHIFAILYVLGAFIVWALEIQGGFAFLVRATVLTFVIVILARLLVFGLSKLIERIFRIDPDLTARNPRLEARANRYLPIVRAILFGLVYVVATLAILQAWGLDILGLLATEAGRAVVGRAVTIVVVIVAGVALWELINGAIDRYMLRLSQNARDGQRAARMRTLLPMLDKMILVTMVVAVTLIVLSELGVNIGPLLAGAGVIGLAIGFGAQTLVKDVITGVFNIIEDSMAVGDIVTVAGQTGTVEDMSMRSVVLRDFHGTQHTIPFSSVAEVQNLTKDFAYSIVDIGVSYREDVDEVMALINEIGAGMRSDPDIGLNILDELEMWGLNELADSAVVIRCRFKCAPGSQWRIRREMNRRVKAEFDRRGIEIPFPHMTLYFGEGKQGGAPPAHLRVDAMPSDPSKPEIAPQSGPDPRPDASSDASSDAAPQPGPPAAGPGSARAPRADTNPGDD